MLFAPGWDRQDRWTLEYVDPQLEREYQHAGHSEGVRRARTASLVAIVPWLLIAIIGPSVIDVDPTSTWLITASMILLLLGCAALSHWAITRRRRDAIGLGQQFAAGVAVVLLSAVTGTFAIYALPGVMLTAAFGYSITRHPFIGAIAIGSAYLLLFLAFAIALGLVSQLPLQMILMTTAVVVGCVGAYTLERSQRATFAQARLVSALRERLDLLLHQYLSPEVASAVIADPTRSALGGQEVVVTVLFADLRGYTSFAEGRSPAAVVAMLNDAFGVAVPIVLAEGGTIVQFVGDALMAIFNAPHPQPDHALRAARAALAMQRSVGELPGAANHPKFRVGLNSGPALVGNIGGGEIRNFAAIGDTTNLAARLQTYAAEGTVVIGARTYELIRDEAVIRPLGSPELKGKSHRVEIYELLALKSTSAALTA